MSKSKWTEVALRVEEEIIRTYETEEQVEPLDLTTERKVDHVAEEVPEVKAVEVNEDVKEVSEKEKEHEEDKKQEEDKETRFLSSKILL